MDIVNVMKPPVRFVELIINRVSDFHAERIRSTI